MGKKLIIKGANFSENGFRTSNVIDVKLLADGTNPYKFYFLPTALTYISNVNTDPELPNDAVANSVSADGTVNINSSNFVSFLFGKNTTDKVNNNIKSLSVNYNKNTINDANQMFISFTADVVDLRGVKFGKDFNANKMFARTSIADLRMPDVEINGAAYMFYNYCALKQNVHGDFRFIKKVKGNCVQMFRFLKCTTADFSGIDISGITDGSSMFESCTMAEIDLSTWAFPADVNLNSLFSGCTNLITLHIDKWVASADSGIKYNSLFTNCNALTKVFVSECSSAAKTFLIGKLNTASAGGSSNWVESTEGGKAVLVPGA
jgi:hypothetical protein